MQKFVDKVLTCREPGKQKTVIVTMEALYRPWCKETRIAVAGYLSPG